MAIIKKIDSSISTQSFADCAAAQGKSFKSIPLRDKHTAKLLWNENSVDCYIMKNGKIVEACASKGPKDFILQELESIIGKLEKLKAPGFDFVEGIIKTPIKK